MKTIDLMHWPHHAAMLGVKAIALYALVICDHVRLAHFWQLLIKLRVILLTPKARAPWYYDVICIRSIHFGIGLLYKAREHLQVRLQEATEDGITTSSFPLTFTHCSKGKNISWQFNFVLLLFNFCMNDMYETLFPHPPKKTNEGHSNQLWTRKYKIASFLPWDEMSFIEEYAYILPWPGPVFKFVLKFSQVSC